MTFELSVRIFILLLEILLFLYFCYTVVAIFKGAAPIPSLRSVVKTIVNVSELKPGELLIDLGSGNGRILMAAAAQGATAIGYELNPFLCWLTRCSAKLGGHRKVSVLSTDMWKADLTKADVVTAYLVPKFMEKLKNKVFAEMKDGSRLVLAVYPLPDVKPESQIGNVYLYKIKRSQVS